MHDVVVAGGGPAGLAVAIGAARQGMDVVVVEKRTGVIDKACGEGLMPGALQALQALGVDPPGAPITGITYRQADISAVARFNHGSGRGVRRVVLHDALRSAALRAGVRIESGMVGAVEQTPDDVRVGGLRARYLVAADGLHSPLRTALGLDAADRRPPRWGLRRHYTVPMVGDTVEVVWNRGAEAYVTPIDDNTVGVAVLTGRRGGFEAQLAAFPALAERLQGCAPASTIRGAGPLRQRCRTRVAGRVLLVGDAAGYVDALTGEGLALALAAARELVRCLNTDRPQDYERAWTRASRRSRWITEGLLWARTHRATSDRIVPLAARAPRVFAAAVNQLAR
jgi:flavin-dependent dehydrogenase